MRISFYFRRAGITTPRSGLRIGVGYLVSKVQMHNCFGYLTFDMQVSYFVRYETVIGTGSKMDWRISMANASQVHQRIER